MQSVGLSLIVERDREIERFVAEESYKISGNFFLLEKPDILLSAELNHEFKKEKDALNFLEKSKNAIFTIKEDVYKRQIFLSHLLTHHRHHVYGLKML